jgi:hypothetical protein
MAAEGNQFTSSIHADLPEGHPAATASATQVRRPIYSASVQRWRQYERQLAPLRDFLQGHGIACD